MSILFVGPLPPPVHGFSAINEAMLSELQRNHAKVDVFDRAPTSPAGIGKALLHWLTLLVRYSAKARHAKAVYIGFSGGKGQLLDLPFISLARWFDCSVYLHHHSFAYLNRYSRITAWCLRAAGSAHHIVLGDAMAKALQHQYAVASSHMIILSNAAFLTEKHDAGASKIISNCSGKCTPIIGYLSNITAEKGIFDFFAALAHLRKENLPFQARIAGPVDPAIKYQFDAELAGAPEVQHVGPVYKTEKAAFFQSLDILVFPTRYINEAEPVTIYEAMQAGARVIAAERGCISGMVPPGCGQVVDISKVPIILKTELAALTSENTGQRAIRRQHIVKTFTESRSRHRQTLAKLISALTA